MFYVVIIIMFWGVIRKYISLSSICQKNGKRSQKRWLTQKKGKTKGGKGVFIPRDKY